MPTSFSFASPEELALAYKWERLNLIEKAEPEKASIHQFNLFCGDPRRPQMYRWLSENFDAKANCCDHSADPMIVPVPYYGAAMALGLGNPVSPPDDYIWKDLLWRFKMTQEKIAHGQINQINLVHHWPCRMAALCRIGLEDSIPLVLMSKARIKSARLVSHVAPLLWFDVGPDEHLVWRIKLLAFIRYFKEHNWHHFQMLEDHRIRLLGQAQQEHIQLAAD
jgi:hypothetical protein